jgi:hypothetical protein
LNAANAANAAPAAGRGRAKERVWGAALLGCYVAIRGLLEGRYRLFDPDEALEMLAAGSLRDGKLPYLGALSHRGPFLVLLYGLPCGLFGPNGYRAVHAFCVMLFVALGVWFQRCVARSTSERTGLLALANLLLLATVRVPSEDNWALNSDFLMGGLATLSMSLLLTSRTAPRMRPSVTRTRRQGSSRYAAVGFFLALALLTKQSAAPYAVVPLAYVFFVDREESGRKLAGFAGGFALPLLLTVATYASVGQLRRAWYFFYEYNRHYVAAAFTTSLTSTIASDATWLGRSYGEFLALAAVGAMAFANGPDSRERRAPWLLAAFWTAAGLFAAIAPGKSWDNYLWASHAPIALLAALGTGSLLEQVERSGARSALKRLTSLGVIAVPLVGCAMQLGGGRAVLRSATEVGGIPPPRVPRGELLEIIARVTTREDTLYVTGYAPEMYVLAARRPASRHVVSNFVESVYPGRYEGPSRLVPEFFAELGEDLRQSRPRVVLDACALGFLCHPSSALTKALPQLLGDYHPLPDGPPGVFLRND